MLVAASAISNATSGCAAAILSVQASPPHTVKNWRSPLENISEISQSILFCVIYGSGNELKNTLLNSTLENSSRWLMCLVSVEWASLIGVMSSEESYLAIQRYLTDEREPYAPGTHGNTKRKIRKAAACYIVRSGILYYQRRQKGLDEFTELEVVLQAERRKELITEAHITSGGEHLNQQQTWEIISQKYWWRGTLITNVMTAELSSCAAAGIASCL